MDRFKVPSVVAISLLFLSVPLIAEHVQKRLTATELTPQQYLDTVEDLFESLDGTCNFLTPDCEYRGNCWCDVNEKESLTFYINWEWTPPDPTQPMCTWADGVPIPPSVYEPGASFPAVERVGSVVGTFGWSIGYCDANGFDMFFYKPGIVYAREECDTPLGQYSPVMINVHNSNRAPSIMTVPWSLVHANVGEELYTGDCG